MTAFFHEKGRQPVKGLFALLLLGALSTALISCASPQVQAQQTTPAVSAPIIREHSEPSGLSGELCFNAWDDDQNGLIDDGCGLPQGLIQVVLAWTGSDADLDLHVADPKGQVAVQAQVTECGLTLNQDCPRDESCSEQNVEVVYLHSSEFSAGNYKITVRLEKVPPGQSSVQAQLGVRTPSGTFAYELEFFAEQQEIEQAFVVASRAKKE